MNSERNSSLAPIDESLIFLWIQQMQSSPPDEISRTLWALCLLYGYGFNAIDGQVLNDRLVGLHIHP